MTLTAFPSGHVTLTSEEFDRHYRPLLLDAIAKDHRFVIGSSAGTDTIVLDFLLSQKVDPSRITMYLFEKNPTKDQQCREKCAVFGIPLKHGFTSYTSRDAEMTGASDYDIAWVRPPEEAEKLLGKDFNPNRVSGTQLNIERRQKNASKRPPS